MPGRLSPWQMTEKKDISPPAVRSYLASHTLIGKLSDGSWSLLQAKKKL